MGALITALVACSSGKGSAGTLSGPPPQVLAQAITNYANGGKGTVTLGSFGSIGDFNSAVSASGAEAARNAKLFGTSGAVLSFDTGAGQSELDLKLNGEDRAADVVATRPTLYLRVDLAAIGSGLGVKTSTIKAEATALGAEVPGLAAVVAGKYGSVDMKSLTTLVHQIGGTAPAASATAGSEVNQLFAALRSAFASGQATKVGSDGVGDHYRATIQPGPLAQNLESRLSSLVPPLSALVGGTVKQVNGAAAKPVTVDVWVSGSKVKQMEIDFRQYHQGAGGPANPVGIKAVFAGGTSVVVPSGATPVDLSKVGGLIAGLLG
jgi:hypothetical protein